MVAPFTDLRNGDALNLIYLVLLGFITRPTLLLCLSQHTLLEELEDFLQLTKYHLISTDLCQSVQNRIAFTSTRLPTNNTANKLRIVYDSIILSFTVHIFNRIVNVEDSNCDYACVSHVHSYIESRLCLDGHAGGMFIDVSVQTSLPTYQSISRYQQYTHTPLF